MERNQTMTMTGRSNSIKMDQTLKSNRVDECSSRKSRMRRISSIALCQNNPVQKTGKHRRHWSLEQQTPQKKDDSVNEIITTERKRREKEKENQEKTRMKVEQMIEKIRNDRSQRRSVYKRMMNKEIKKRMMVKLRRGSKKIENFGFNKLLNVGK